MKKLPVILLTILIFISSCGGNRDVTGAYFYYGDINVIASTRIAYFDFDSDGTFRFGVGLPLLKGLSTGTWTKVGNHGKIAIKSYIRDKNKVPMIVAEDRDTSVGHTIVVLDKPLKKEDDDFVFWTLDADGIRYPFLGGDTLVIDKKSITSYIGLSNKVADSLDTWPEGVMHRQYKFADYFVKDKKSNVFHISFPKYVDEYLMYYIITTDTVTIRGNTLRTSRNYKMRRGKRSDIPSNDKL